MFIDSFPLCFCITNTFGHEISDLNNEKDCRFFSSGLCHLDNLSLGNLFTKTYEDRYLK